MLCGYKVCVNAVRRSVAIYIDAHAGILDILLKEARHPNDDIHRPENVCCRQRTLRCVDADSIMMGSQGELSLPPHLQHKIDLLRC